jgi:hypothetical protein
MTLLELPVMSYFGKFDAERTHINMDSHFASVLLEDLLFAAGVGLVDGALHGVGHLVGVEYGTRETSGGRGLRGGC